MLEHSSARKANPSPLRSSPRPKPLTRAFSAVSAAPSACMSCWSTATGAAEARQARSRAAIASLSILAGWERRRAVQHARSELQSARDRAVSSVSCLTLMCRNAWPRGLAGGCAIPSTPTVHARSEMGSVKPRVSPKQALALATAHWGLTAEDPDCCKALAGYDDANFVITGQLHAYHRRRRRSRHPARCSPATLRVPLSCSQVRHALPA